MEYRREIDGLRALAVMPVIFFHAGFEWFSGGFVGVDVFFVISGYLITTILLTEIEQGKFSLLNFYERRARRILPVLFFVMFACVPFAWMLLSQAELLSFSKSLVAVSLFLSNIFFLTDGGYFETASELKPLLHTWSLAVEEQFYLIFPLILLLFWRFGRVKLLMILAVAFCSSIFLAQWASHIRPDAAFYVLPTRGWELLLGAFGAFYLSQNYQYKCHPMLGEIIAALGFLLLCIAVFAFDKSTPWPGVYTLLPTLGTLLLIVYATKETFIGRFLGNKAFVGLGLISYSAYLWHQPVLAFARHWLGHLSPLLSSVLIGLILLLSVLSWRYVESPFRKRDGFGVKFIFGGAGAVSIAFIVFGYLSSLIKFNQEELMALALSKREVIYSHNVNERYFIRDRIKFETLNPEVIVVGSSRIMQAGRHSFGLSSLNLSVSGASLEDLIAISDLGLKKFNPKYVVIGADPWIFNRRSGQSRWTSLRQEYTDALDRLGVQHDVLQMEIGSSLFFNDLANDLYAFVSLDKRQAVDDQPTVTDKIRRDGSRVYNLAYANKSPDEVARASPGFITYAMGNYEYEEKNRFIFERFLRSLKEQNKIVSLVLSPYHPVLYDLMRTEAAKFLEIERIYRSIADSMGIEVLGSYDPVRAGCSSREFFDGMHPKDSCIDLILSRFRN